MYIVIEDMTMDVTITMAAIARHPDANRDADFDRLNDLLRAAQKPRARQRAMAVWHRLALEVLDRYGIDTDEAEERAMAIRDFGREHVA